MQAQSNQLLPQNTLPVQLYNSAQVYAMEQAWFSQGHDSFGLMQQAAWQMAKKIEQIYAQRYQLSTTANLIQTYQSNNHGRRASIWVGRGNNGGDGWLVAHYLRQAGWQVEVVTAGFDKAAFEIDGNGNESIDKDDVGGNEQNAVTDATKALKTALAADCRYRRLEDNMAHSGDTILAVADIYIDALFGIGLSRKPDGIYEQAIHSFNNLSQQNNAVVIAIDIPSGLVASTGQVFDSIAIQADVTLCLVARKLGLHTKDGMDYCGDVIDIPLIPFECSTQKLLPIAKLVTTAHRLPARRQNSYKGSYGHVLIIGGNQIKGSQGMGGAAILSAASAMATGAGKITVACHKAFHGALLTSLPDAMTLNLHDDHSVHQLIEDATVIGIGMGLGRDDNAKALFISYMKMAIAKHKPLVIDADGLYHLASLHAENNELVAQLREYSSVYQVCLTPHSGEAAKLLGIKISDVEADRVTAIKQCAEIYGGDWVLKGSGSLTLEQTLEQQVVYVCGTGNAGMASAGMGDVLSGVITGLLAQKDLEGAVSSVHQAVLIHGLAGDTLVNHQQVHMSHNGINDSKLMIGQRGLQAQDMPAAIRHVMQLLITDGS